MKYNILVGKKPTDDYLYASAGTSEAELLEVLVLYGGYTDAAAEVVLSALKHTNLMSIPSLGQNGISIHMSVMKERQV